MLRIILSIVFITYMLPLYAQMKVVYDDESPEKDSLKVVFYDDNWAIRHKVKKGETLFMLARRFHVPPALVADLNNMSYQSGLSEDSILYIPLGAYNQVTEDPNDEYNHKALYYDVQQYDNLFRIAHVSGVQQKLMQQWNGMENNYITEGMRLFVGWVMYDHTVTESSLAEQDEAVAGSSAVNDINNKQQASAEKKVTSINELTEVIRKQGDNPNETIIIIKKKPLDTLSEIEKKYMWQTSNEETVSEEKGTAVFFDMKGKVQSIKTYYAFHNTAQRGTIIKIYNPGTDKTVYAKVLGPLPNTKQYHGAVIGISNGAKEELLVPEDRTWCELKYAPTF